MNIAGAGQTPSWNNKKQWENQERAGEIVAYIDRLGDVFEKIDETSIDTASENDRFVEVRHQRDHMMARKSSWLGRLANIGKTYWKSDDALNLKGMATLSPDHKLTQLEVDRADDYDISKDIFQTYRMKVEADQTIYRVQVQGESRERFEQVVLNHETGSMEYTTDKGAFDLDLVGDRGPLMG